MHNQLLDQSTDARQEAGIFLSKNKTKARRIEKIIANLRLLSTRYGEKPSGSIVFSFGPDFQPDTEFLRDNFGVDDIHSETLAVETQLLRVGEVSEEKLVIDFFKRFPAGLPKTYESEHFKRISNTVSKKSLIVMKAPLGSFTHISYLPGR